MEDVQLLTFVYQMICFLLVLFHISVYITGHSAVVGLVNDKLAVQPATTIGVCIFSRSKYEDYLWSLKRSDRPDIFSHQGIDQRRW